MDDVRQSRPWSKLDFVHDSNRDSDSNEDVRARQEPFNVMIVFCVIILGTLSQINIICFYLLFFRWWFIISTQQYFNP